MAFQEFSRNYLSILMVLVFQYFFRLLLAGVFPVILILDLNDLEFTI